MANPSDTKSDPGKSLVAILAARIRDGGPIPFSQFMSECLYHPEYGYYSRPNTGRFGDYYTSVDVHPIFGRLLTRQFAEMWKILGTPSSFMLVEAGGGVGRLAAHVLDFAAREFPAFYAALTYLVVERSPARRAEHTARLASHVTAGHVSSAAELPQAISAGCIFSNELLDALPTHRVAMERGELREVFVGMDAGVATAPHVGEDDGIVGGHFTELLCKPSTPELEEYFREQGIVLPDGQQAEVCLDACQWIEAAGRALVRGFVITIDYGHEASALYDERHNRGTLLAYREHAVSENLIDTPGMQDLTSHVNFTAVDLWGQRTGLERTGLVTQSQFLVALGRSNEFEDLYEPEQTEVEKLRARLLLKNLIHPEGLGEKFQVLIQHKGIVGPKLTGLSGYLVG